MKSAAGLSFIVVVLQFVPPFISFLLICVFSFCFFLLLILLLSLSCLLLVFYLSQCTAAAVAHAIVVDDNVTQMSNV